MIHCNHAGSAFPRAPGLAAVIAAATTACPSTHAAAYERAHASIAAGFGLPSPHRLLLTTSCTQALAIVLADLPWRPDDVVLTSSLEHHALLRPVHHLVRDRGVRHVAAPYRPGTPIDLDAVATCLRRGRVRLVAVTGASNITGEVLPIAELAGLAHAHGAKLLLDGAQLAGVVPLDLGRLGVDLFVFAGHKGLHGPLGIGGLWAAESVAFACPAAGCELGSAGATGEAAAFPGFCDVGSVNLPAAVGLAAAMQWLAQLPAADRERPRRLAAELRGRLRARWPDAVLGGDGPHTGTTSLRLPRAQLARAQQHCADRGIAVRVGQHCAPGALAAVGAPLGCLRVGFGTTNADRDLEPVFDALAGLLAAP